MTKIREIAREWMDMPVEWQFFSLALLAGAIACVTLLIGLHFWCDGFMIWHLITRATCQQ